jgi:hypothetical protein
MSRLITIVASMGGVAFLFLGFTWGEGLLSQEYISRADCLVLFFSGLGTAFCISILILGDDWYLNIVIYLSGEFNYRSMLHYRGREMWSQLSGGESFVIMLCIDSEVLMSKPWKSIVMVQVNSLIMVVVIAIEMRKGNL